MGKRPASKDPFGQSSSPSTGCLLELFYPKKDGKEKEEQKQRTKTVEHDIET